MEVSVSETIDQKTYPKKFREGFSSPWIRLWVSRSNVMIQKQQN